MLYHVQILCGGFIGFLKIYLRSLSPSIEQVPKEVQKILPIRLAPNFLKSALYGIAGDRLREAFLQFILQSVSRPPSSTLGNMENIDMYELLDLFSTYECKVRVTKENP